MNILFLCTGNSCRSQMAEGLLRSIHGETHNAYSAGTKKSSLNTYAVQVMKEIGIDISSQDSKTLEDLKDVHLDVIFTVCNGAHETCPFVSGTKTIHVPFDDPPHVTKNMEDGEEKLNEYRRVRDEIKSFIEDIQEYF